MEGNVAMVDREERARKPRTRRCVLCGGKLTGRGNRPAWIAPAFAFQALNKGADGVDSGGAGVTHAAGTRICTRHELVWDVEGRKPRAVWAGDGESAR